MVYIFLADGFEEIEALCPLDIMLRAGLEVKTVSINGSETVTGSHGIRVYADKVIDDISLSDKPELVMLPGGMPGTKNLEACETVHDFINDAVKRNAYVAAICAAPLVLGKMGLLDGREAICYPGFEEHLKGAALSQSKVVKDGNIITAKGMGVSLEFALKLVETLCGSEVSEKIKLSVMAG